MPPDIFRLPPQRGGRLILAILGFPSQASSLNWRAVREISLATAEKTTTGLCWASSTPGRNEVVIPTDLPRHGSYARYLHTGIAGIGLFLADLASISGERRYLEAAEESARWLLAPDNATKDSLPGLYFGEAGVAAFLARMSQITGDVSYLNAASSILKLH